MVNESSPAELRIRLPVDFGDRVQAAVGHFWQTKEGQAKAQGEVGRRDRGERQGVTGGKQMDGFAELFADALELNGIPESSINLNSRLELPGYFRPSKKWDLIVVHDGLFLAAVELKSLNANSVGNNYNNRTEEAIGTGKDIWTAFREGAFGKVRRPWIGYLFLLEDAEATNKPVQVYEPHFEVFPVFKKASYAERLEEMCRRLVSEGLYDASAFIMALAGDYDGSSLRIPAVDLAIKPFVQSLLASAVIGLGQS